MYWVMMCNYNYFFLGKIKENGYFNLLVCKSILVVQDFNYIVCFVWVCILFLEQFVIVVGDYCMGDMGDCVCSEGWFVDFYLKRNEICIV